MVLSDGLYRIQNYKSGTYLDYGRPVHMRGWDGSTGRNQQWELHRQSDNTYKLRAGSKGGWLYARGGGDDTNVAVSNDTAKKWDIRSAGSDTYTIYLHGTHATVDLGMGHKTNGTSVNMWASSGVGQQKWRFIRVGDLPDTKPKKEEPKKYTNPYVKEGRYHIRNCLTGTVLEMSGASVTASQQNTNANQIWQLEAGVNGFHFKNAATGTYLSAYSPSEGTQASGTPTKSEWDIKKANECYVIEYGATTLNLDIAGGNANDGAAVIFWNQNGARNQQWEFLNA